MLDGWLARRLASATMQTRFAPRHRTIPFASLGLLWMVLATSIGFALAQGTKADYERAAGLAKRLRDKVLNASFTAHWIGDGAWLWYSRELPGGGHEYIIADATAGTRAPAFDHARLAAALAKATDRNFTATNLPLDNLTFDAAGSEAQFGAAAKRWVYISAKDELREKPAEPGGRAGAEDEEIPTASTHTGGETSVTFVNRTRGDLELVWLDEAGQRHSYGKLKPGEDRRQHTYEGHAWLLVDASGRPVRGALARAEGTTVEATERSTPPRRRGRNRPPAEEPRVSNSPDGKWTASISGFNVQLRPAQGGAFPLTWDGNENNFFAPEFFWSPDSRWLVVMRTEKGDERKVNLIESSPKDQLQPKLLSYAYDKPGDRLTVSRPHLFDLAARKEIALSDALFPNPWSLSDVRWAPDSTRFTFLYNQRGHQVLRIVAVEVPGGSAHALVDEQSPTFVDYAHKLFMHWLDETGELIWMSERDGWNHLYLFDTKSGQLKNAITHGDWVVRSVEHVDAAKRQVWFRALGIRPGQDPYQVHFCRVNFDGSGLVILTEGDGSHAAQFSPDRRFLVDTWSRVDRPPVHELRSAKDGRLVCELERADSSRLEATGWRPPERFVAKGRDGQTDIYGVIHRPTNFDPTKKYPVIENIYAGPQDFYVPKTFRPFYRQMEIAELGFIVVQIDGLGTNWRDRKFHDVCWKNLGDAGFPDRIAWMKAAAEMHPELDLSRVGVYGGSAGGQNAVRALIDHHDFYQVSVADCGCHDNRMDKVWWNELWMGWPIGPQYVESSNVEQAGRLEGKLFLTVGELDHNVDPASTMQLVNALIAADKDFDFLVVPGSDHGAGESKYAARRRQDFFVRNLLGVEPRRAP